MAGSRSALSEIAPAAEPRRTGRATLGGRVFPLAVTAATRLSLQADLQGGARVEDGTVFDAFEIDTEGGPVRLGRCRFATERGAARDSVGRLVFLDDVHDCRALVLDGRLVDLRGFFQNLPLVLAQRDRIRPEFKEHVANVAYDLAVYKRFFDEQDRILSAEPEDVARTARQLLLATEGRQFFGFLDKVLDDLERIVGGFSQEEHERHGFYLRRQLWPYLMSSAFLRRTNVKPRGYAGDAELMIMLYENAYLGATLFEQLMHKHPCETRAADAVRARKLLVPRVLREARGRFGDLGDRGFRFLSLAAGPARELEDIVGDVRDAERVECTMLDQDPFALDLARATVRRIEAERNVRVAVRYVQDSVRTMLRSRDLSHVVGRHHFVYSMGLFDYLTAPVARAVLRRAYDVLEPGGTLLVGNYHERTPTRFYMAYWADWSLCYRSEESFLQLADGVPAASAAIEFDASGCQMFLRLEKPR
jgi:extracellular factor (EF) 3-hydroxypalmitic acid methyl ester biosynthesis protein